VSNRVASSGGGWFTILIAIGGIVWLVNHLMSDGPPVSKVTRQAQAESALSLAVSGNPQGITNTAAQELNSKSTGQLEAVRQMIGGEFDGKTFVLPGSKK
jgi:hypothetical protein